MESFELTYFCSKDLGRVNQQAIIFMLRNGNFPIENRFEIECFDEEDKDYVEIRISIYDLTITEDNLHHFLNVLSVYASNVFKKVNSIQLATGIYELTYYYTERHKRLTEFDENLLAKFPVIIIRNGKKHVNGEVVFQDESVICIYNESAQFLY